MIPHRPERKTGGPVRTAIVGLAVAAAVLPVPASLIERWYSTGIYPWIQRLLTTATNPVPIALLDVAVAVLLAAGMVTGLSRVRLFGLRRAAPGILGAIASSAAVTYLMFLFLWGLNYRRVPLDAKLAYDPARLTREHAIALAASAVAAVNERYEAAHSGGAPPTLDALALAFDDLQRDLGAARPAVPGVPKRSVLHWYFPRAGIDGMTDPFFLEVIVNPQVLPFERPFVVAHEWAHLAGYAVESEANFVAWLTCARAGILDRYSGDLAAYQHALSALSREDRAALPALNDGPRADLRAVFERYRRTSPQIRRAAHGLNDRYLRANGVSEGVGSYGAVVRLMLGTTLDEEGTPRRR